MSLCPDHRPPDASPSPPESGADFGRPAEQVDVDLLDRMVAAVTDKCIPCQVANLDAIQVDPVTIAGLVSRACWAVAETIGGLPAPMVDPDSTSTAFTPGFRVAAAAGCAGGPAALFQVVDACDVYARRAMAGDAIRVVVAYCRMLATGEPFVVVSIS